MTPKLLGFLSLALLACSENPAPEPGDAGIDADTDAAIGTWTCTPNKGFSDTFTARLDCEGARESNPTCFDDPPTTKCAPKDRASVCGTCEPVSGPSSFAYSVQPCSCTLP